MAVATTTALVIGAAVSAGTAIYSSEQQAKAAERAGKKDKEARAVASAEQAAQQGENTRAKVREERIRRAQILQSSTNTGATGSSGEIGSIGGLQTSIGANLASAARQGNSANAITGLQQSAADIRSAGAAKAATAQAIGGAVSGGVGLYGQYQAAQPPKPTDIFSTPGGQSPATVTRPKSIFDPY
jgi:hypothetical protein